MADDVKNSSSSAKENNVSKGIMLSSYDLYFMVIVIKHSKQTNNCKAARNYTVFSGRHLKMETA
jgi:hypothetical protein